MFRLQGFMTFGTWRWWGCQPQAPANFTPRNTYKFRVHYYYYYYYYYHHHHHHHHPYSLHHSSFAGSQKSMGLTDQTLLTLGSAENFVT